MPIGQAKFGLLGGVVDPGKLELLETKTISSSLANFISLKEDVYNVHFFTLTDCKVTTQTEFGIRVSDDGGTSYETSNYLFANQRGHASGTSAERKSSSQGSLRLGGDVTTDTNSVFNGYFYMYNAGDSSKFTHFTSHCTFNQGSTYAMEFGGSVYAVASTINAIQIGEGILGAFSSGKISAYGIAES